MHNNIYVCVCVCEWVCGVWVAWDVQVLIIYCMFALHSSACEMRGKMPQEMAMGWQKGQWRGQGGELWVGGVPLYWHLASCFCCTLMRHLHISPRPEPTINAASECNNFARQLLLLMQIKVPKDDWKLRTNTSATLTVCVWDRYSTHVCFGLGQACIIYSLQLFWPTGLGRQHSGPHSCCQECRIENFLNIIIYLWSYLEGVIAAIKSNEK